GASVLEMDSAGDKPRQEERDARVLSLYEQVLEIEQRLIPTGLHVFGVAPDGEQMQALLQTVASFDRFDPDPHSASTDSSPTVRALTDLIALGLGLESYQVLVEGSGASESRALDRERVESLLERAIETFLSGPEGQRSATGAGFLLEEAGVPGGASKPAFDLLCRVREQLSGNAELDALAAALRGDYIVPGPGADIIQNPDVLPTGRNTHAVNPYLIPSRIAVQRAAGVADALLQRFRKEKGRYPETMAMVLWGIDNIKTQGEAVAQALHMLGVKPRRDSLNRATGVEVIPLEVLGRPRIDVVMTVSGIFCNLFASPITFLDTAMRPVS